MKLLRASAAPWLYARRKAALLIKQQNARRQSRDIGRKHQTRALQELAREAG
tara:strand:+ start:434 stop:589 length:156 start_codon:yes stop_codon:yes gene_type:complete